MIWLGALLIPILGLVEVGGWSGMVARIHANFPVGDYTHLWRAVGTFSGNPMGIHWTGIVFAWGGALSCGYWTTDFLVIQRTLAAKNLHAAKMAPLIGAYFKMIVPFIVILPGLLGLAVSPFQACAGKCHGARAAQLQRTTADHAGALLRAGPAGFGDYSSDCRIHVGDGGKRYRLRDGVDV